ncbi:OsmC family protein [Roseospira goensis]|uniref:Organic hydroperoxide reductase OsmC/OhrA n=1 Tax=Roseospira goensis TaxID=391922 RepID=A0A7W6S145_9PROT|nr:OsmC family protein [Roseospira goensis]MBB4286450.1 organic hydroperoxide reductase OsmC/OhrA [Roseospira goensis]
MSLHTASVHWQRAGNTGPGQRHGTAHVWRFDGGAEVKASSSPHVVPPPHSTPAYVDPEEALVAAAASCHMLFFLHFAADAGHPVADYQDAAEGVMGQDAEGRLAITRIRLRPRVRYHASTPDRATERALHERAHHACFIANSLRTEIETLLDGDSAPAPA